MAEDVKNEESKNVNNIVNNEKDIKSADNKENPKMKIERQPKGENEKKIFELEDKLDEAKQELDEKDDRIKRLMAEFENFKKRSSKEREGLFNSVMGDVVLQILPIVDNLEKAAEAETSDTEYQNGIKLVLTQLQDTLKKNGVKEIEAVGKKFDPSYHEAVSSVEDPNLGEKVVKQEYRKGYMIGDRVLRHSLVIVAN